MSEPPFEELRSAERGDFNSALAQSRMPASAVPTMRSLQWCGPRTSQQGTP